MALSSAFTAAELQWPAEPAPAVQRPRLRWLLLAATSWFFTSCGLAAPVESIAAFPPHLRDTGLPAAGATSTLSARIVSFLPQYPLWSDGAGKRRWLYLPPGSFIDGSRPDAWEFPIGTRLWKEFSHAGRPVETRFIERAADGSWRFATYVWNQDGSDAVLAPERGIAALRVPAAPRGRYAVPSRGDCMACHGGGAVPVLGVSALQLSGDRDPLAANGRPPSAADIDLRGLVARGWLRGLPAQLVDKPPRIAARTPLERAALGYLHGNCSHCHNTSGSQAPVRLTLAQSAADPASSVRDVLRSAVEAPSRYRPPGAVGEAQVVVPGSPQASVLGVRMRSRHPRVQMPPLATDVPDPEGLALVYRWITHDLPTRKEPKP
ncbi:hypothetical protein [Piscinibacter sp.]|uniref:hypothetical protein n=1 Tax=Piscinibacter sp. TaxID=1903157 RepID=UPI002C7EA154|nr:hypothetical protein [Albitalea sp.]HUG25923.1 hypothetical protein [Albitalea sp.]